jgi:hypothetical protein
MLQICNVQCGNQNARCQLLPTANYGHSYAALQILGCCNPADRIRHLIPAPMGLNHKKAKKKNTNWIKPKTQHKPQICIHTIHVITSAIYAGN